MKVKIIKDQKSNKLELYFFDELQDEFCKLENYETYYLKDTYILEFNNKVYKVKRIDREIIKRVIKGLVSTSIINVQEVKTDKLLLVRDLYSNVYIKQDKDKHKIIFSINDERYQINDLETKKSYWPLKEENILLEEFFEDEVLNKISITVILDEQID